MKQFFLFLRNGILMKYYLLLITFDAEFEIFELVTEFQFVLKMIVVPEVVRWSLLISNIFLKDVLLFKRLLQYLSWKFNKKLIVSPSVPIYFIICVDGAVKYCTVLLLSGLFITTMVIKPYLQNLTYS